MQEDNLTIWFSDRDYLQAFYWCQDHFGFGGASEPWQSVANKDWTQFGIAFRSVDYQVWFLLHCSQLPCLKK